MVNERARCQLYLAWSAVSESVFIAISGADGVFAVQKLLRHASLKNNLFHIGNRERSYDASVARINHDDLEGELFR